MELVDCESSYPNSESDTTSLVSEILLPIASLLNKNPLTKENIDKPDLQIKTDNTELQDENFENSHYLAKTSSAANFETNDIRDCDFVSSQPVSSDNKQSSYKTLRSRIKEYVLTNDSPVSCNLIVTTESQCSLTNNINAAITDHVHPKKRFKKEFAEYSSIKSKDSVTNISNFETQEKFSENKLEKTVFPALNTHIHLANQNAEVDLSNDLSCINESQKIENLIEDNVSTTQLGKEDNIEMPNACDSQSSISDTDEQSFLSDKHMEEMSAMNTIEKQYVQALNSMKQMDDFDKIKCAATKIVSEIQPMITSLMASIDGSKFLGAEKSSELNSIKTKRLLQILLQHKLIKSLITDPSRVKTCPVQINIETLSNTKSQVKNISDDIVNSLIANDKLIASGDKNISTVLKVKLPFDQHHDKSVVKPDQRSLTPNISLKSEHGSPKKMNEFSLCKTDTNEDLCSSLPEQNNSAMLKFKSNEKYKTQVKPAERVNKSHLLGVLQESDAPAKSTDENKENEPFSGKLKKEANSKSNFSMVKMIPAKTCKTQGIKDKSQSSKIVLLYPNMNPGTPVSKSTKHGPSTSMTKSSKPRQTFISPSSSVDSFNFSRPKKRIQAHKGVLFSRFLQPMVRRTGQNSLISNLSSSKITTGNKIISSKKKKKISDMNPKVKNNIEKSLPPSNVWSVKRLMNENILSSGTNVLTLHTPLHSYFADILKSGLIKDERKVYNSFLEWYDSVRSGCLPSALPCLNETDLHNKIYYKGISLKKLIFTQGSQNVNNENVKNQPQVQKSNQSLPKSEQRVDKTSNFLTDFREEMKLFSKVLLISDSELESLANYPEASHQSTFNIFNYLTQDDKNFDVWT